MQGQFSNETQITKKNIEQSLQIQEGKLINSTPFQIIKKNFKQERIFLRVTKNTVKRKKNKNCLYLTLQLEVTKEQEMSFFCSSIPCQISYSVNMFCKYNPWRLQSVWYRKKKKYKQLKWKTASYQYTIISEEKNYQSKHYWLLMYQVINSNRNVKGLNQLQQL